MVLCRQGVGSSRVSDVSERLTALLRTEDVGDSDKTLDVLVALYGEVHRG